jgi:hypothetical protein
MATIRETIGKAIDEGDAATLGRVVDFLRGRGANYADLLALAQRARPTITVGEWETLMEAADAVVDATG